MADNVTLPGTGEVVATDDIGGVQFQQMKLVDGTLGSNTASLIDSDRRLATFLPEKYTPATTVTAGTNSTGITTIGYTLMRVEMDTAAGQVPIFQVSANNSSGWREVPLLDGPAGIISPFVASTSGQVRWVDVTGWGGVRCNHTSGTSNCTFNATLVTAVANTGNVSAKRKAGVFSVTALNSNTGTIDCDGVSTFISVATVASGTWSVNAQWSADGTNWYSMEGDRYNTSWAFASNDSIAQHAGSGQLRVLVCDVRFARYIRLNCTAFTAGSGTIHWTTSDTPYDLRNASSRARAQDVNVFQAGASLLQATVVGNIGSGGGDSGNPVKIGGVVFTGAEAIVSNAQRINTRHDKSGRLVVQPYQHRERVTSATLTISNTVETNLITGQGAGVFTDMSSLSLFNSSATTTTVTLRSAAAGAARAVYVVPAGGGVVHDFTVPLTASAANNPWTIQAGSAVSSIIANAVFVLNQ